ncbi:MAG: BTAD domain-containing putative transcriptional regulator [Actinomycetota bacterium]|jgi:DNA-binding SARP family transcriptional activator|nr:BTAD domain-containing putative transcriptional regulator [Actinomycetota bacterium]
MSSKRLVRLYRVVGGLGALVLLAGLVVGIPWALWHFVGWPLPHHVPTAAQVGRALDHQGIPAQSLVDALAVVVWLTWAVLMVSLAAEIPAALSGRRARRLPLAGAFQPLTGRLVAAVAVACLALAPRPGHTDAPGPPGGRLALVTARRPAAALVLDRADLTGATLTGATRPPPVTAAPARQASRPPRSGAPPAATGQNAADRTYVVQRGDTLWGIAERELGDPLQWQAIYQLNEGRPQPGGATLTDPHWIDPGWTLLLPAVAVVTPTASAPVAPPAATPPAAPRSPAAASTPPAANTAPDTTSPPSTIPATPTTAPNATNGSAHHTTRRSEPVRLPSGSIVAGSFAVGVLTTVALGRLRKRHAYRYRPPEPGRDLTPEPLRPALRRLAEAAQGSDDETRTPASAETPVFPVDDDERRLDPGQLEVGTRDSTPVTIEVTELSGIALQGPPVDDVARALVAGLLVRAVPGASEVLLTNALADRLFPGLGPDWSLRRVDSLDHLARVVEAERIGRARRLARVDAPDAVRFRHDNPENPLPLLVVPIDDVPGESRGRWAALLADAPRLGIAVVLLDDTPIATGRLDLDADGVVLGAVGQGATTIAGAALYRLRADEAVELLGAVNDARREADADPDPAEPQGSLTALHRDDRPTRSHESSEVDRWPGQAAGDGVTAGDGNTHPLAVRVLGPYRITFGGEVVTTGLRSRAKLLLAWSLLRPEGATIDELVDTLWPDTPPDRLLKQFWHPLGDLRTFFRGSDGTNLEVLEKTGEHYRPNPAEITCDLWDFQAALGEAAYAQDDDQARAALARAVDAYGGDLLAGLDHPWVEAARQDLHRRAVDAHLRLAELEEHAGRPDAAIDVLERIIGLDRYAEEPYRRLMTLQAAQGRLDAVAATWRLVQRRLAELDLDVDDATARLYHALTPPSPDVASPRSVRLSS